MPSTQRKVALAFLDAFKDIDIDAHLAIRAPNCLHTIAPASLNYPTDITNDQFAEHLTFLKQSIASFPVTAREIFGHEGSNQVTIWADSNATFREEVKDEDPSVDWSYLGEYIFILMFDSSGAKIERIVEFVDSKKVDAMKKLVERAMRNKKAREGGA